MYIVLPRLEGISLKMYICFSHITFCIVNIMLHACGLLGTLIHESYPATCNHLNKQLSHQFEMTIARTKLAF